MAQTGFTPIQLYSTSTAAAVPTAGNLTNSTLGSELAINITDGKLFYKDNAGVVQVIGWKVVPATAGGTGQTSYAVGDLLYADTSTSLAKLADVATGNALISGGVGVAPAWGKIGLTTHVTGTLPVSNGGTGTTTAFTVGSVVFAGASGVYSQDNANLFWDDTNNRLGIGTATPATRFDVANASGRNVRIGGFQFAGTTSTADAGNNLLTSGSFWNGTNFTATATSASGVQFGNGVLNFYADTGLTAGNTFALTTRFSVSNTGNATINNGNLVIGTSGKGIDFSATAGTGTSELLADYEEGAWTPTLTASGGGITNQVYATQSGTYTKVGRQVTIRCVLAMTSFTNAAGNYTRIEGLPFTPASASVGSLLYANFTGGTNGQIIIPVINTSAQVVLEKINSDGQVGVLGVNSNLLQQTASFTLTGTYFV